MTALHQQFLEVVEQERSRGFSRRTLFVRGGQLAAGGAIAAAAASSPAMARLIAAQDFMSDIDVLNFALTLEHLEYAFYRDGLAIYDESAFEVGVFGNLILARDHELAHVEVLSDTIVQLGGTPVQEAVYDFGYADPAGFLAVAAALENTGVSAYDGAAQFLENVDLLNAAGTIVAIEARHASYLNLINGQDPFPDAFEPTLTQAEVLDIAGQFIVG